MLRIVLLTLVLVALCSGRPEGGVVPQNVVTVPPNCPPGQQWINGACRDVWPFKGAAAPAMAGGLGQLPPNVVTVPPNCPPGQQLINGACRDVWNFKGAAAPALAGGLGQLPPNVITVPPNCPAGQEYINGQCRDVWKAGNPYEKLRRLVRQALEDRIAEAINSATQLDRNIISVPNQCPEGTKPDANGRCRPIFD